MPTGRWKGQAARFVGIKGRRYKLWWYRNQDGIGGIGILLKELCEKVVKIRRKNDRVMAMGLFFGGSYESYVSMLPRWKDQRARKINFMTWQVSGNCKTLVKVLGLGDFNGHVGRRIDGFKGVHGGY